MKVSIIGSGNVATILAQKLRAVGCQIVQVYSQTLAHATTLAQTVQATAIDDMQLLNQDIDVLLFAVSDKAIAGLAAQVHLPNVLVLHTAGSVPMDVLANCSKSYGVLYPVQSIRKQMAITTPIPFMIEGNTVDATHAIEEVALSISEQVVHGDSAQRVKLHVAAVFVCNFVNYLYLQSARFCAQEAIPFALLQPLIEETALRLQMHHPAEVFTGPAVRGDVGTIDRHEKILQAYPDLQQLYHQLSQSIMKDCLPAK